MQSPAAFSRVDTPDALRDIAAKFSAKISQSGDADARF